MSQGRVDPGWAPEVLRLSDAQPRAPGWIAAGLGGLFLSWLALSAIGFVQDSFARSTMTGWLAVVLLGGGLFAVLWGVGIEVRAFQRLLRVEALRELLANDESPVDPARALTLEWLDGLSERFPDLSSVREAVAAAPDVALLRAALRRHLAEPLRQATRRAGDRAALEGGALVAISPSPALDGMLAGLRDVALLR